MKNEKELINFDTYELPEEFKLYDRHKLEPEMVSYIGGYCSSCGTKKEWGLCPNKKCDTWTFGDNLEEYDEFFKRAKEHYSMIDIIIKGIRNYHSKKSFCPTCKQPFMFEKESTICGNCKQKLKWGDTL